MKKRDFSALAAILGMANVGRRGPIVSPPTLPRVKPWLSELDKKCKRGATSPSVPTRQRTRAIERTEMWNDFRMKRTKKGRLWNHAGVIYIRSTRRIQAQLELKAVHN